MTLWLSVTTRSLNKHETRLDWERFEQMGKLHYQNDENESGFTSRIRSRLDDSSYDKIE